MSEPAEGVRAERIMVVEDEPVMNDLVSEILRFHGFEVASVLNGENALAACRERLPAAMLLDIMLPDINGNIVCQRIRSDERLAHTRIIIVSGAVDPTEVESLRAAGADDFIKKPFDIGQLISRMVELLRG